MYCYYTTNSSWSMTDVVNDIAALCSGTLVASLSASCNKSLSYQTGTTISAGWTIYDSDTAQTAKGVVLSCADVDNLSTKYWNVYGNGGTISHRMVEDWNTSANTTTNAATVRSPSMVTAGVAFSWHIFCTPQYIYVTSTVSDTLSFGCFEIMRDTPYMASASPMPLVGLGMDTSTWSVSGNLSYMARLKHPTSGATLLTTAAGVVPATISTRLHSVTAGYAQSDSASACVASDGSLFHPTQPLYWAWYGATAPYSNVLGRTAMNSSGHGPMLIRSSITGAALGDIIVVDGQNYMIASLARGLILPVM